MHEKTQEIWVSIEGQKVDEKCASEDRVDTQARREENRLETQARRQEGSRRDWHGLNRVQLANRWDQADQPRCPPAGLYFDATDNARRGGSREARLARWAGRISPARRSRRCQGARRCWRSRQAPLARRAYPGGNRGHAGWGNQSQTHGIIWSQCALGVVYPPRIPLQARTIGGHARRADGLVLFRAYTDAQPDPPLLSTRFQSIPISLAGLRQRSLARIGPAALLQPEPTPSSCGCAAEQSHQRKTPRLRRGSDSATRLGGRRCLRVALSMHGAFIRSVVGSGSRSFAH